MAVWMGNKDDELPLRDRTGAPVTESTLPAQIYRGFLTTALAGTPPASAVVRKPRGGNAEPPAWAVFQKRSESRSGWTPYRGTRCR